MEAESIPHSEIEQYSTPVDRFNNTIIALTNPDNTLARIELALKNKTIDENNKIIPLGHPLMNDEGVSKVLGSVLASVNDISFLSHMERNDVNLAMMMLSDTIIKVLMTHRKAYEIKDQVTCDQILDIIQRFVLVGMRRSLGGGERRFWKGTQAEHRIIQQNEKAQKSSNWFQTFNPF